VWADPTAGYWRAPDVAGEARFVDSGWKVGALHESEGVLLVANSPLAEPSGVSRVYSEESGNQLVLRAESSTQWVGQPALLAPGGIVSVDRGTGQIAQVDANGTVTPLLGEPQRVSTNVNDLTAAAGWLYVVGNVGGGGWNLYVKELPLP
jgi:hypothetical protein